jgi:hypothetical protein
MIVAFGRCRFRLNEDFTANCLSKILGGPASAFHASQIEDRIFFFLVSSKQIGFQVYKIRNFVCNDFELFFQLYNEAGLSYARAHINPKPNPWVDVRGKSYAAVARKQSSLLSGANRVPIGPARIKAPQAPNIDSGPSSNAISRSKLMLDNIQRSNQSIYEQFKLNSAGSCRSLDKHVVNEPSVLHQVSHSVHASGQQRSADNAAFQIPDLNIHLPSEPDLNLDLNLNFGNNSNAGADPSVSLDTVSCRRCYSISHSRWDCTAPIKCDACSGWGHIAVNCDQKWKRLVENMKGRRLDNFAKDFGGNFDYSSWFKAEGMTVGPSSPPSFPETLNLLHGSSASPVPHRDLHKQPESTDRTSVHPGTLQTFIPPPLIEPRVHGGAMAFRQADPRPYIPRGLH